MTPEEIKNTDFETFFQAVPQMKEVHHIKATGQEIYHVYKHDVVYVTRPGAHITNARTRSKTRIRTEEISGDSLCAGFRMAEAGSV